MCSGRGAVPLSEHNSSVEKIAELFSFLCAARWVEQKKTNSVALGSLWSHPDMHAPARNSFFVDHLVSGSGDGHALLLCLRDISIMDRALVLCLGDVYAVRVELDCCV